MKTAVLLVAAMGLASSASGSDLVAAWQRDGRVERRALPGSAPYATVPLGSVWKLFVYAYAVEQNVEMPPYRCGQRRAAGDEYCCNPGDSIERDRALARSCGRFFDPARLGIEAAAWRAFWTRHAGASASWLLDLRALRPERQLPPEALLSALAAVPPVGRSAAQRALLGVFVDGYGHGGLIHLGGMLRVKTFTWEDSRRAGASIGGGAGWLIDGTPVWFAGSGASRTVLTDQAPLLAGWFPAVTAGSADEPCVLVRMFERYPIRAVDRLVSRQPAAAGPLHGQYRVRFENGQVVTLTGDGELFLEHPAGAAPTIQGRFALSEYLARVVDREADATVTEAARALAVVARTWTLQNAPFERGCFQTADSTRMQRVSANPPTAAARAVVWFTDGLVLHGEPVRYHRDTAAPGVLSWNAAVRDARRERAYDEILRAAFPRATLAAVSGERECRRLDDADAWLTRTVPTWRRRLAAEPGFEPPDTLGVCGLDSGNPYADRARQRIYVRGVGTREDRVTVAHEYVHLAFRFHPNGRDEAFVEALARDLVR
jgi:uncharacterized protein YfaQ (DUF2300 family)